MTRSTDRLRIVVMGWVVRGPLGGMAWHHLQYVLGFAQLGHDVYFVEDSDDFPSCYHPRSLEHDADPAEGLDFTRDTFERLGLADCWAYFDAHTDRWLGPAGERILGLIPRIDLLVNVSGVNLLRPWFMEVPVRVMIDTDPAFTQIHNLTNDVARERALQHSVFVTFGENVGKSAAFPDDGLKWKPTRQPIVLPAWPVTQPPRTGNFTTVMHWDSYRAEEYEGIRYGMKSISFDPVIDLPRKVSGSFEIAVVGDRQTHSMLENHGWAVADARSTIPDPWTYRRYIQDSRAEFSVAKHGYVTSNCGWFSERSAAYLASGRPVVAQDTGFSDYLPTGEGILSFSSLAEAHEAVESVNETYERHCKAAREIAEAHFDANIVLPRLLEQVLETP